MNLPVASPFGVCAPAGYRAAGVAAGIKGGGALDCAVVLSEWPATLAAVFTTNVVKAAPVLVSTEHLVSPYGRGVVLSSGNANAATGIRGRRVAESMCAAVADVVGCAPSEVLIGQTGLIGVHLDEEIATTGARRAAEEAAVDGARSAATAIMTTDTHPKVALATTEIGGRPVTVGGMAKGAAMLAPSMATMLAVVTTDAAVAAGPLKAALVDTLPTSFEAVVVDDMSTNDSVFVLANGASDAPVIETTDSSGYTAFASAVAEVAESLALAMVRDAEGSTKFFTMRVTEAASQEEARRAARAVCRSILVKCSLAGEDPYWGRIFSELGASGVAFDPTEVTIAYGPHVVCRHGEPAGHDIAVLRAYMGNAAIEVTASLGSGAATAVAYGSDLTPAYVDENMGTS